MNRKSIKMISEAGLFTAIYAMFMLFGRISGGFLESLLFFILPFPMILFTIRYNIKNSLILYVSMIILCLLISPISTLFYIIPAGALGMIYSLIKQKNKSEILQIFITISTCFIVNILTMHLFSSLFGYDIYDDFGSSINAILKLFDNIFSTNLASNKLKFYIDLFIPSIILIASMIEGDLMHMVCSLVLEKLKIRQRKILPFFLLQIPKLIGITSFIFVCLGAVILLFIKADNGIIFDISKYILAFSFLGYILLFVQGISRIACHLLSKRKAKWFSLVLLFSLLLNILVIIFGFIAIFNDNRDDLLYNVGWKE